jgi:hypothetical protein
MNRRGFTVLELIGILLLVALLAAALIAVCAKSGPLTEQDGRKVADDIHGNLLELIGTSETPVDSIVAKIRTDLTAAVEGVNNKKGAKAFTRGLCAQLITLTENRIRSTPDQNEKRRLTEFLARLRQICADLQQTVTEPTGD